MTHESQIRSINQQVVRDFLRFLSEKNLTAWADLWAEDAVQEMPFASAGFPKRVEGRDALIKHYGGLPDAYGQIAFLDLRFYPMADPNWLVAEFQGDIEVIATKRSYNTPYCCLYQFHEGKILLLREYFNPTLLSWAFGSAEELAKGFSIGSN